MNEEILDLAKVLDTLRKYVDDIDFTAIADTYKCGKFGSFQRRVGRDDHYFFGTYKSIASDDEYIRSLFPLSYECDYYSCNGRGDDEVDYDIVDEEETETNKQAAISAYSKENHYAYLVYYYFQSHFNGEVSDKYLINILQKE